MRPPALDEHVDELRRITRGLGDEFRLRVVYPLIDLGKIIARLTRDAVEQLREWLTRVDPEFTPARARFVEYGVDDDYLGAAFVLHDRLTDSVLGPFTYGELEDVANTTEAHPTAYADAPGFRYEIEAGRTTSVRVVLPGVLL